MIYRCHYLGAIVVELPSLIYASYVYCVVSRSEVFWCLANSFQAFDRPLEPGECNQFLSESVSSISGLYDLVAFIP